MTRTVGWFTSLYPVLIESDPSTELGRLIKQTKEMLREIPHQGSSYGVLRYMARDAGIRSALPDIRASLCVNFLGDFDGPMTRDGWTVSGLSLGPMVSPKARRPFALALSGFVAGGKLRFSFHYNSLRLAQSNIRAFADAFLVRFRQTVEHCRARGAQEVTPSDLTYSKIGLDELEALYRD